MNPIGPPVADAELATAVAAGDRKALAAIFDRYAPRLLAFSQSMLHNRADAEDCLQDIFILAATRIGGLREPDRLRSWLFAIARHECLRRLDRKTREVLVEDIPDRASSVTDHPAASALDNELAALLRDATAGLADRDRLVLDLADRQGLDTGEVAAALSMSPASTYKLLTRARTTARKSIGALLVARTGRANCPELDALLGSWNGSMTPLLRKRVARHIEDCERCQEQERRVASPAALLGTGTAFAMPIPIRLRSDILDSAYQAQTRSIVSPATDTWSSGWPPRSARVAPGNGLGGIASRGPVLSIAAAVAAVLVIGALVVVRRPADDPQAVRGPLPAVVAPVSTSGPVSTNAPGPTATPTSVGLVGPASSTTPAVPSRVSAARSTAPVTRPSTGTTTPTTPTTPPTTRTTSAVTTTGSSTRTTTPTTTSRTSTTSSTPTSTRTTTTTSTTRTTPTTTTRTTTRTTPTTTSAPSTAPVITDMSVACQVSGSGTAVPILTWSTTNTRSMDLSVDNPDVVGSYGTGYPPSGQLELPPNGCDPTQGTQIYTVYANGTDGTVVHRTINWTPPPVTG